MVNRKYVGNDLVLLARFCCAVGLFFDAKKIVRMDAREGSVSKSEANWAEEAEGSNLACPSLPHAESAEKARKIHDRRHWSSLVTTLLDARLL